MFKSIKWKIVVMFMLMITSVILLVGTFFRISISNYYSAEFEGEMASAFGGEFMQQLTAAASGESNPESKLTNVIDAYAGRLGAGVSRGVYLLDGASARIIYSTEKNHPPTIEKTPNIISALAGHSGAEINQRYSYMDYAAVINKENGGGYIIYVKDNKQELAEMIATILQIILQALVYGLLISFVLGYFMSKTITSPIISLTRKAENMRAGEFETKIEVRANDEIGELTTTFNLMSSRLKQTLTEIEAEKNKMETILMFLSDGVAAFDDSGKIIHINHAAKRILQKDNVENENFDTVFESLGVDVTIAEIMCSEADSIHRNATIGDKHTTIFFATASSEKGAGAAVIAVIRDVTEQYRLEMSRREFVSNVSHELRTPITTVKSYVETIIESPDLPPELMKNFLSVILSESDRMTRLVYDLLELSRLDYQSDNMVKDYFDLKVLMNEIIDKLSFEAESYGHEMELSFAGNIAPFFGNRDRIEQVITNIITNAMKYTPHGGKIMVSGGQIYDSIYIKVKDNGIGIPKEDLPYIFDRFYRVDKARSRMSGGTGLGLAIAKEIIHSHGGTIKVESEVGKGSEFILKFPCKKDLNIS